VCPPLSSTSLLSPPQTSPYSVVSSISLICLPAASGPLFEFQRLMSVDWRHARTSFCTSLGRVSWGPDLLPFCTLHSAVFTSGNCGLPFSASLPCADSFRLPLPCALLFLPGFQPHSGSGIRFLPLVFPQPPDASAICEFRYVSRTYAPFS